MEPDELSQLMPNLQSRARLQSSPGNTVALREYIKVLGEKPGNVPAATTVPHKPRTDGLQLRAGTGRRPPRRYFTIKFRAEDLDAEQQAAAAAAEAAALDPEALKDALLEQGKAQRRALMEASLRPGTGRVPRRREFTLTLPPLQLEVPEEQLEAAEGEKGEADVELQLLAEEYEAALEAEAGMLAQAQAGGRLQPANASPASATAVTPGAALLQQGGAAASTQQQQADSQQGRARTPGTSLYGRYTPMEGVPERLALLAATRGKQLPATVSRLGAAPALTPAGFTPLEGIPERLHALSGGPRLLGLPGATRVCSNEAEQQSVDSPVEGLVQQGARRSRGSGAAPAPANAAEFAGFAPPPADDDDDMGGGFGDGDYEGPEADPAEGFPLLAGDRVDAGMQTGASLEHAAAAAHAGGSPDAGSAAAAAAGAGEPAPEAELEDDYDAGDFGGDFGMDDYEQPATDADLPESSGAAPRRARKQTANPGIRLRNELKRKSLAVDPNIGRHDLVSGVRRSSRSQQKPLKWWLNEKKEFGRQHKTMPTVCNVVEKVPNTPWQTVTDIRKRPAKKQRQRAPTPHDLEGALQATEAEQEEEQGEEEAAEEEPEQQAEQQAGEEDAAEEQEEQERPRQRRQRSASSSRSQGSGSSRQSTRQKRQAPAASRRQPARGKAQAKAAPPAAKGKATKTKAAGSRRQGRR